MKKLLVIASLVFAGAAAHAATSTVWVRGDSAAAVEAEALQIAQQINNRTFRGQIHGQCDDHTDRTRKAFAVSGPSKSYRADRYGNLNPVWTATVRVSCRDDD